MTGVVRGFAYKFDSSGAKCFLCGASDKTLLIPAGNKPEDFDSPEMDGIPAAGLCEPCAFAASWAWRRLSGEVPPTMSEDAVHQIASVRVLIARRTKVPKLDASEDAAEGERWIASPVELNSSYEFLCAKLADGSFDLPGGTLQELLALVPADNRPEAKLSIVAAACKALESHGITTWPALVEPLVTSYGPRGRLVAVVVARGWAMDEIAGGEWLHNATEWKPWPLSAHTGTMAGFYTALETAWALRLYKHCSVGAPEDLCVRVHEAARRYIALQEGLRSKKIVDASMALAYRMAMSADEQLIEKAICKAAIGQDDELAMILHPTKSSRAKKATTTKLKAKQTYRPPTSPQEEDEEEEEKEEEFSKNDEEVEGQADDEEAGEDDGAEDEGAEGEEGFVRPGRPLRQG